MSETIETSTTITTALRQAADLLDQHPELPRARVSVSFHDCSDEEITAIIGLLPNLRWVAKRGNSTDWVEAPAAPRFEFTAFAKDDTPRSFEPRLAALIPAVG